MWRLAAGLIATAIIGCTTTPQSPGPSPEGPSCGPALAARGAILEKPADLSGIGACSRTDAIQMSRSSVALDQPVQLGCQMALRLIQFEDEVLQPAAQRHFGRAIARIRHLGGYSCRARAGDQRYVSEHALANAIDIAGFDLADGTQITVDRHWRDSGPRGAFLHDVARGACKLFQLVLTPKTDWRHRDHFHLDLGRYQRCDA